MPSKPFSFTVLDIRATAALNLAWSLPMSWKKEKPLPSTYTLGATFTLALARLMLAMY